MFVSNFLAPWQETFAGAGDGDGGDHFLFNTKIKNSKFDRGSGRILIFAKWHYLFTTKTQKSEFGRDSGPHFDFWFLLAIIIYLIPKFKILNSAAPAAKFWILLSIIFYLDWALWKNWPLMWPTPFNYFFMLGNSLRTTMVCFPWYGTAPSV